jgi:formylglycine-generating enzyme required for sulfatase activity
MPDVKKPLKLTTLFFAVAFICLTSGISCSTNETVTVDGNYLMALVPAGSFPQGCDTPKNEVCAAKMKLAVVESFYIGVFETTAKEYKACIDADYCENPRFQYSGNDRMPAQNVNYYDAVEYCQWRGMRLPTSIEWEKAARGKDGGHAYPWGETWNPTWANWCDGDRCDGSVDGYAGAAPVDAFPENVSPYGVRNMAGNMQEWVAEIIPKGVISTGEDAAVWRGGGYFPDNGNGYPDEGLLSWYFGIDPPYLRLDHTGFRCAVSAEKAPGLPERIFRFLQDLI